MRLPEGEDENEWIAVHSTFCLVVFFADSAR